jgi:hypothetical protein
VELGSAVCIPVFRVAATDDDLDHKLIGLRFRNRRVLDSDFYALANNSFLHACRCLLCLRGALFVFN